MSIVEPHVLSPQVLLIPVSDLPAETIALLRPQPDDVALTLRGARKSSKILDADTARLLEYFRTPARIVDVVLRYSLEEELEPEAVLEAAYPTLEKLIRSGFLVPAGDPRAQPLTASLENGQQLGDFRILRLVRLLSDTEIYQAESPEGQLVAVKLARPESMELMRPVLQHEARVLQHLGGEVSPHLLATGEAENGCDYLAMTWCLGEPPQVAEPRRKHSTEDLLALGNRILAAYTTLHRSGVLHGDVHPGNLLLGADNAVTVLDFGGARFIDPLHDAKKLPRFGLAYYYEPEYAQALLEGVASPPYGPAAEQFRVAALVYYLLTGHYYADFPLDREEMLKVIASATVTPLAERGLDVSPSLEAVLRRALSASPSARFPSLNAFEEAFARASQLPEQRQPAPVPSPAQELLDHVLVGAAPGGAWFEGGFPGVPVASVHYGASGLAHALYQIALHRESSELLALADIWLTRALERRHEPKAFYDADNRLTAETVGHIALFHTASGMFVVQALIAHAQGARSTRGRALDQFMASSRRDWDKVELSLGRAGTLLGCAQLYEAFAAEELLTFGKDVLREIWQTVDEYGPIGSERELVNLGMSHGWAGVLYATLRFCSSTQTPFPTNLVSRLDQLAQEGETRGRGMRWRWLTPADPPNFRGRYMPGWCNGSTGFVFLWSAAHQALQDPRWLKLAVAAGQNAWEGPWGAGHLCCGRAGAAYAMLNLDRLTGDDVWRERARRLLSEAAQVSLRPELPHPASLYKGELGPAVLAAQWSRLDQARMPFFESEGWQ